MLRRNNDIPVAHKRLVRLEEGAAYYGVGLSTFRRWAEQAGAVRKIGRCWTADRKILDAALDGGSMDGRTANTVRHSDC